MSGFISVCNIDCTVNLILKLYIFICGWEDHSVYTSNTVTKCSRVSTKNKFEKNKIKFVLILFAIAPTKDEGNRYYCEERNSGLEKFAKRGKICLCKLWFKT